MTTYISGKFRLNFVSYLLDHKKRLREKYTFTNYLHLSNHFFVNYNMKQEKWEIKKIELKGGSLSFSKWEYFDTN